MTIFKTKPQYLLAIPKAEEWEATLVFKRIYQIDYDITIKNMQTHPLTGCVDRSIKPVIIITLWGGWENPSYRWYRPNNKLKTKRSPSLVRNHDR